MNLLSFTCPRCTANIDITYEENIGVCKHCGMKLDLGNKMEVTQNITKTNRVVDDAKIIRVLNEEKKSKRSFLFGILITLIITIGVCCIAYWGIQAGLEAKEQSRLEDEQAIAEGKIHAGNYYDFEGKNYKLAEANLRAAGFTNIELVHLDDVFLSHDEEVVSVSVNGNMDFHSSDWFYPTDKVVITYH